MDTVKVAYLLMFALMGLPPALGIVVPFPVNTITMSFLCIYIGSHLSLRAVHAATTVDTPVRGPRARDAMCLLCVTPSCTAVGGRGRGGVTLISRAVDALPPRGRARLPVPVPWPPRLALCTADISRGAAVCGAPLCLLCM